MRSRSRLSVLAAIAALGCTVSTAQAVTVEEVGDGGLRSPRHLDFAPSGNLYIAEAGGRRRPVLLRRRGSRVHGRHRRGVEDRHARAPDPIVDGLASYANDTDGDGTLEAGEADSGIGPHGITALSDNGVFITNGGPTAPRTAPAGEEITRDQLAAQNRTAKMFGRCAGSSAGATTSRSPTSTSSSADGTPTAARSTRTPPTCSTTAASSSSPTPAATACCARSARTSRRCRCSRTRRSRSRSPPIDMQAVPTGIVEGPDGAYYMSQLTGFPFPVGGANVYRIDPRTGKAKVFASGFTMIMDLAFDKHGTLYVLEIDSNDILPDPKHGAIHSITKKGKRSVVVPPDGKLTEPGGIAVGKRGDLYVTNFSRLARRRAGAQDPLMTSQARRTSASVVRSEPIASRST